MAFSCRGKTKCLWRHRTGCRNYLNLPFCPSLMGTRLQHFKNEVSSLGERKSLFSTSTDYKRSKLISSLKRTARKEKAVNYVQGWLVLSRWSCFQTWPWLCMVQWSLAVTWEMPWAHTRPDTIGFFAIWSFLKHGQMGLLSEQHSFEGSDIRQELTIRCQSAGTIPRQECFRSVHLMYNFPLDSLIHQLCSLLSLLLHSRSLLVKSAPTCLLFNHAITIRRRHLLFDFLFSSTMAKRKKKNKTKPHTLFYTAHKKYYTERFTTCLRTITRMNKTIKTEESNTLF